MKGEIMLVSFIVVIYVKPLPSYFFRVCVSVFLLYFTGQIRWLALNGLVGLSLLWIFNLSGMDSKWVVFSTHSVGYMVLAAVIVIMILVFGGVVLVWTHLIDFLKSVLVRYPQVKDELSQRRVLEQVILRCLSDSPHDRHTLYPRMPHLFEDVSEDGRAGDGADEESVCLAQTVSSSAKSMPITVSTKLSTGRTSSAKHAGKNTSNPPNPFPSADPQDMVSKPISKVLDARRPDACFFCLKKYPIFLLPACEGWNPEPKVADGSALSSGISMCTPYTELARSREQLSALYHDAKIKNEFLTSRTSELERRCFDLQSSLDALRVELLGSQRALAENTARFNQMISEERRQREVELQHLLQQHNAQLTELKKQQKVRVPPIALQLHDRVNYQSEVREQPHVSISSDASALKHKPPSTTAPHSLPYCNSTADQKQKDSNLLDRIPVVGCSKDKSSKGIDGCDASSAVAATSADLETGVVASPRALTYNSVQDTNPPGSSASILARDTNTYASADWTAVASYAAAPSFHLSYPITSLVSSTTSHATSPVTSDVTSAVTSYTTNPAVTSHITEPVMSQVTNAAMSYITNPVTSADISYENDLDPISGGTGVMLSSSDCIYELREGLPDYMSGVIDQCHGDYNPDDSQHLEIIIKKSHDMLNPTLTSEASVADASDIDVEVSRYLPLMNGWLVGVFPPKPFSVHIRLLWGRSLDEVHRLLALTHSNRLHGDLDPVRIENLDITCETSSPHQVKPFSRMPYTKHIKLGDEL